ncbi:MAG: L-rhamnose isomerase [Candidatus Aminicenantes bacterium]|nr:L-rhamnose isomerase [Candidatus Aminicenantes bacterium]
MRTAAIDRNYGAAREAYALRGVDTEEALVTLSSVPLSLPCWQGDDIGGFEKGASGAPGGGLQVTGGHPGKARTIEELQSDLETGLSLIPGRHRVNLHAMYGDFRARPADRDAVEPDHFLPWADWAEERGLGLDFNATCFSHPLAESGFTLSHRDRAVRGFWVEHVRRCRIISAFLGRRLGSACLNNLWIPDGSKETPSDRWAPRERLRESLDAIYAEALESELLRDSLESKLFGIGSESYVVGSHEFYLGYALSRGKMLCLDLGHFHPTESVADKISSILTFFPELALHISRGVRWDSDHVAVLTDELLDLAGELVRGGRLGRVRLALDFFDASLNRVAAWVIGARAVLQALLRALLEPAERLRRLEDEGDRTAWLALREAAKTLPWGAVWDAHCLRRDVPPSDSWLAEIRAYERRTLSERGGDGGS